MFHLAELSAGPVEGGAQVAGGDRGQADRVHGHHGKVWTFANLLDYQMFFCISFSLILERDGYFCTLFCPAQPKILYVITYI